jgi:hypothetical protein
MRLLTSAGRSNLCLVRSINQTEYRAMSIHIVERVAHGLFAIGMTIVTGLVIFA